MVGEAVPSLCDGDEVRDAEAVREPDADKTFVKLLVADNDWDDV